MVIYNTIAETHSAIEKAYSEGKTIGFVPTMGALHEGHISLVEQSVRENDITVVSIFVNPLQFNNSNDLQKYPRVLENDCELLKNVGVGIVFAPSEDEMYPAAVSEVYDFGDLGDVMEGKYRPGHFNGVAIVVKKLFEIVMPHNAYFGEKDFQQLMIIKKLVRDHNIPVKIIPCPISRETDGLARSSRNTRLSTDMRESAPFIYQQLLRARSLSENLNSHEVESEIRNAFNEHKLLELEYFSIADGDTLQPIKGVITPNSYAFIAVNAGDVRLIDNIRLI